MQIKMDFDQLEDYIEEIDDIVNQLEGYIANIDNAITNIVDVSSGQFFDHLEEEVEHRKNNIDKVKEYMEDLSNKINKFLESVREYDENETSGEYSIDTDEVEEKRKKFENFKDDMDITKVNVAFEYSINKYEKQKTKYELHRESDYQLEQDYKEHQDTADYLKRQKIKIDEQLDDYYYNKRIKEEVDDLLKK